MSEFVSVCKVGAIDEGGSAMFPVGDVIVAIFREKDEYFAINDFCPHMGASLGEGHFEDGHVTCPWHAWTFSVRHGGLCDNSAIRTDAFPVRVVGDEVQVCLTPKPVEGQGDTESKGAPKEDSNDAPKKDA